MRSLTARLLLVTVAVAPFLALASGEADAATTKVTVGNYWFCDASYSFGVCPTSIDVGDTVTWNFPVSDYHTVTHCTNPDCAPPNDSPLFDSGLRLGGSYSFTFMSAGVYLYYCQVHSFEMRGEITVGGAEVGGIAELPEVDGAPLEEPGSSSGSSGAIAAAVGGAVAVSAALGLAAWYVRRRLLP